MKLTKEQAIIISGFTGVLFCKFSDLHGDIEKRLGRPVYTMEIPSIEKEIQAAYREDFFAILPDGVQ